MRRVRTWTKTYSDARVLVTANDIGRKGWLEVYTRMPKGSVIDVTPPWQQRQLRYQEYRSPALIAAGDRFLCGIVVLFAIRQNYDSPPRESRPPMSLRPSGHGAPGHCGRAHGQRSRTSNMRWGRSSRGLGRRHRIREEAKGPFRQRKFTIRKRTLRARWRPTNRRC